MKKDYILVGKVSGSHGLKGGLNLVSFAESLDAFSPGSSLYLKNKITGEFKLFETISASKKKSNVVLVLLNGVQGRNEADLLKGMEVYIDKASLPEPEDDSYYWSDLIGMEVFEEDGNRLGRVKNLMRTGSSDILEVLDGKKEVLVPFLKKIILSVSKAESKIIVELPEGLVD